MVDGMADEQKRRRFVQLRLWWAGRQGTWWWTAAVIVVPVMLGTSIAVTLLLAFVDVTDPKDQIELLKTGLTVGAGAGGVAALVLAGRRQWSTEQANRAAERDAAERRITDLYTKAADQLGSDESPVRLAGLYALERLAQDNPSQRQTIVNVFCGYLRMPFDPPPRAATTPKRSIRQLMRRVRNVGTKSPRAHHDPHEELLVRKTVQHIIHSHLFTRNLTVEWPRISQPTDPKFWPGIELDLSGATLVDFMLQGTVQDADFSGARFVGAANFAHASFDGHVYFSDARFEEGGPNFLGVWFGLRATFSRTDFGPEKVIFTGATFCGMTYFKDAVFRGGVTFESARALVNFNHNWGDRRQWPNGWREQPLAPGEELPTTRWGRWSRPADQAAAKNNTWTMVVQDPSKADVTG